MDSNELQVMNAVVPEGNRREPKGTEGVWQFTTEAKGPNTV